MSPVRKLTWEMQVFRLGRRLYDLALGLVPFLRDPLTFRMVALETTTECTRNCPYCPPHSSMRIPRLRMAPELYRRVLDSLAAHGYTEKIFFNIYGEPLTDERLEEWLGLARARLPGAKLIVFTNGDLLTVKRFLSLKKAGMDVLSISQHSATLPAPTAAALRALERDYPKLADFWVVNYYRQYNVWWENVGLLNNKGGLADVNRVPYLHCCDVESAAVDCLGNVLLCNNDCTSSYVFGNVGEKDLYEIWNAPAFLAARRKIMGGKWIFEICRRCMARSGATVAVPPGKAARLPRAFHDMRRVLDAMKRGRTEKDRR